MSSMKAWHKVLVAVIGSTVVIGAAWYVMPREAVPEVTNDGWNDGIGQTAETTFRYPRDLGLVHVTAVQWPPIVAVTTGLFTCNPTHDDESYQAETKWRTIGAETYCVTVLREGAAGSVYASYTYVRMHDDALIDISFTVQMPQCMNYDEPTRGECEREQAAFDPDALAANISQSVRSPLLQ